MFLVWCQHVIDWGQKCAQAKNPSRDLPIAILGSLSLATVLYLLMALAITLMVCANGFLVFLVINVQRCGGVLV